MTIKISKGIIYACEDGNERAIGTMLDNSDFMDEKMIECGPEIIGAVQTFVEQVNSGTLKPKKAVDAFQRILDKYAIAS